MYMNFKGLTITNWGNKTWPGGLVTDNYSGIVSSSISNVQEYFGEGSYAFGYKVVADSSVSSVTIDISSNGTEEDCDGIMIVANSSYIEGDINYGDVVDALAGATGTSNATYIWHPDKTNRTIYIAYVSDSASYNTPDEVSFKIYNIESNKPAVYYNIQVYTGDNDATVNGADIKFSDNGPTINSGKTNSLGKYSYANSNYSSLTCTISKAGYYSETITVRPATEDKYTNCQIRCYNVTQLPPQVWCTMDGSNYVNDNDEASRGIFPSSGNSGIIDPMSFRIGSASGSYIFEIYNQGPGTCYLYEKNYSTNTPSLNGSITDIANSFSGKKILYNLSSMQMAPSIPGVNTNDRKVFSVHLEEGKNFSSSYGWGVGKTGTGSAVYLYSSNLKNEWASYIDKDNIRYCSFTTSSNNICKNMSFRVRSGYSYKFTIHTYSEANYDGVVISEQSVSATSLNQVSNYLKIVSGLDVLEQYQYNATSNIDLYLCFITDVSNLTSDGYAMADVKVVEEKDTYKLNINVGERCTVNGTDTYYPYPDGNYYILTVKQGATVSFPKLTQPTRYCDYLYQTEDSSKRYDPNGVYTFPDDFPSINLTAHWTYKQQVDLDVYSSHEYNGASQSCVKDSSLLTYATASGTSSATNVGSYSVTFSLKDKEKMLWKNTGYASDQSVSWSITQRPVTVTAASNSKTYNGQAITPYSGTSAVTTSNLVSGHSCQATVSRTGDGIIPGTYTYTPVLNSITIYDASGTNVTSNYSITTANGTGTVYKYTPTITLNATSRVYNGNPLYATASVSFPSGGKQIKGTIYYGTSSGSSSYSKSYSTSNTSLPSVSVTNYGESTTVYASFVPDSSCSDCYNSSGNVSKSFSINAKANSSLPTTWSGDSKSYHNTASPTISGHSGGTLYYRTSSNNSSWGSWTTTKPTRTEVGTTYVQCYVKGDNNHNDSGVSSSVSITINKATDAYATIDINSTELTYNGSSQQLTTNLSSHGCTTYMALGSSSTSAPTSGWQTSYLYATNAGTYYVWYKFEPDSNHSNSKSATYVGSKTIKRSTTASASVITGFTQDSNNKKYYTGSTQTGVTGSHVSWSGTTSSVNAGDFTATATPESNYAWSDGSTSSKTFYWRIQKVTPITKLTADSGVYTGSTYYCYFSASVNGIVYETWNGSTPTTSLYQNIKNISANANTSIDSAVSVGSWTINTLFVPTDTTNYNNVSNVLNGWHVSKRKVRFVADDQSKSWDGSALSASNTATLTKPDSSYYDLVSGQTASFACSGSQTSVGSSTKTLSSVLIFSGSNNVTDNYTIEKINGTLTVGDAVKSYNPVASLSNNLSAGGGSATLSAQCTRIWASGKTDTVSGTISKVEFVTNGNSRFAVSTGNATDFSRVITHSSMGTSVTTDYVQVKVTFANSYTATSNTISVSNAVTSTTKPMLLGINWNKLIPASGGTAVPSFSYTQTRTYTSGSQDYPSSGASISYAPAKCVRLDPEFYNGTNAIYTYDNAGSGKVTMDRVSSGWSGTIPNNSGYALKINHTGSGATPGMGGWCFSYTGTAGYTYICTFDAWIPSGYHVNFASNATGNETSQTWESQQYGHGRWETYSFKVKYGTSGSISSTFFFYLQPNSSASYPVTWYVADATICQVNGVSSSLVNTSTGAVTLSSRGTSTGSYTANELGAVMMTITLNGQSGSYVLVPTQEKNEITSHSATTSMSNNFSAGGGYGNVTGSCTRTYTSGSKDSVGISKVEITSNGNERFSVSGTKVSHSSMGTSVATDKVSIRTTFTDGSTATTSSPDIVNKLESISLTLNPSSIKYGGQSTPTTKATYTSGASDPNVNATYTSSDSNVAKVE